ncbi:ribonucleoside-diphosphate reductase [Natronomonas marina]|jgi:ribonucleoside-diphosphate reductase beta chain|uniref:ribonucleoside-diphosphate reductase n=1 Tax=Natronomonas marina TaxID=2961939 RepID=UPI0020C9E164|nr:ribonucleoside-diphosphate reductase [Natronomonas marina]
MTQIRDASRELRIDPDSVGGGYFKHAVYNHWDPYEDVDGTLLEQDRERLAAADALGETEFEDLMQTLALFGAGEEAVTEDLAPLMLAVDDIDDQMFVSSQIYEEAKHTQFFDRYWREVVHPVADAKGFERVAPTDQRFFPDGYVELFDRTEDAMERLLTDDTPENRVKAYSHYHLVVESVLAQTGYYGITSALSPRGSDAVPTGDFPHVEGLVEGISYIRSDEGRHVGFGMQKVQHHLAEDGVDEAVVRDTLQDLMPLVAETVSATGEVAEPMPLVEYAREKLTRRIDIITDREATIPDVEELVALDDEPAAAD